MNKKAYIYISLICILSLVFGCFTSSAASITFNLISANNLRAELINQYAPPYDSTDNPIGDYSLYTYELIFNPEFSISSYDGYMNGYYIFNLNLNPSVPTGYSLYSVQVSAGNYSSTGFNCTAFAIGASTSGTIRYIASFDNFWYHTNQIALPECRAIITLTKPITPSNLPDPTQYISCSLSNSTNYGVVNIEPEPEDQGLAHVISRSIINSINDQSMPFDDILQLLQSISQVNSDSYSAIISYLNTTSIWEDAVEDWLSTIYSELALNTSYTQNIAMYSAQLQSLMSTFPQYSAQVLVLLGKLADMNASQQTEAAAIESQYNSLQEQQDNADAVIEGVSRPTFANGQFSGNNLVPQGQRDTFTGFLALITGNSYITTILLIIVTFATAGFVLFGKKG